MNYPRPIIFKIEKIFGFLLFLVGVFVVLKILNVLDENAYIPNDYLLIFTAAICVLFGIILMTHTQHGFH